MTTPDYIIMPASYSKGKLAVRCPSATGFKTRAGRLAQVIARGRYTGREGAYIMGPRSAEKFERLYAEGWDACTFSYELEPPRAAH